MCRRPLVLVLALLAVRLAAQDASHDLVLRGGTLIDGTNTPRRAADLAIDDGRITAIVEPGALDGVTATRTLDATGLVIAPGFIDTHAHADLEALRRPDAQNFVAMGVTTIITGNCGGSVDDVADHLGKLEANGIALNYGTLIGHGTVRGAVMGTANRAPSDEELARMKELVARAMAAGAFGISTGLIYVPGTYAKTDELVALSEVVGRHGGLYASHMRNEGEHVLDSVREALEIGRRAGLPVHLSHLKVSFRPSWGTSRALCELLESARKAGARVTGDQYVYTASSTSLDVLFPSEALAIGRTAFCEKLGEDDAFRRRMTEALLADMARNGFGDLSYAQIASAPGTDGVAGLRLPAVAKQLLDDESIEGQAKAAIELMVRSQGRRVSMCYHKMCEEDLERILALPYVSIASDAGIRLHKTADKPHPRGAGNNPRVLGRYVRERGVIPLELAVHKMTALPAQVFGLAERGRVAVGSHADLVVFDAATVADTATYDEPVSPPRGIPFVLVNGVLVIEDGKQTDARPGKVLRRVP